MPRDDNWDRLYTLVPRDRKEVARCRGCGGHFVYGRKTIHLMMFMHFSTHPDCALALRRLARLTVDERGQWWPVLHGTLCTYRVGDEEFAVAAVASDGEKVILWQVSKKKRADGIAHALRRGLDPRRMSFYDDRPAGGSSAERDSRPEYVPTPATIAKECQAFQATWTPFERARRLKDGLTQALELGRLPYLTDEPRCA